MKGILTAVTSNKTLFPTPNPPLATFSTDIDAFDKAETAVKSRTKGAAQDRDAKLTVVVTDLNVLRAYVQQTPTRTPSTRRPSPTPPAWTSAR